MISKNADSFLQFIICFIDSHFFSLVAKNVVGIFFFFFEFTVGVEAKPDLLLLSYVITLLHGFLLELYDVPGVGDHIAQKLEGAWQVYCSQNLDTPSVEQISQLKKGDCLQFISSATFLQRRGEIVPTRPLAEKIEKEKKQKGFRKRGIGLNIATDPCKRPSPNVEPEGASEPVASTSSEKPQPKAPRKRPAKKLVVMASSDDAKGDEATVQNQVPSVTPGAHDETSEKSNTDNILAYQPSQFPSSKVS